MIFESKPGETVLLFQSFRIEGDPPSQASVNIWNADGEAVETELAGQFNAQTGRYELSYVVPPGLPLGLYYVEWTAEPASGGRLVGTSVLQIVLATRRDLVDLAVAMPSRITTPDGVTIDYNDKLSTAASMRPVEVGRITKNRAPGKAPRRWEYGER